MERPISTSIRVTTRTRDILAAEAASQELSLAAYLATVAEKAERERAYAQLRAQRLEETDNPEWVAEQELWSNADLDGIH
jgi:hypothetical protein